jgi:multidrug efflux pump subunit AcrA (membrane-fusion protein)
MRKLIIFGSIAGIIVISVILMGVFANMKELPSQKPEKKKVMYVKADIVLYSELESEIIATGRISSREYVDLISECSGKMLKGNIPLKKGQNFRKGDVLVRIFSEEAKLGLKGSKSRFLNLIAGLLPDFKIDYPKSYNNWKNFFEAIDLDKDLPELPEIKSDKEKIYLASRNILMNYYAIKSDEIRLDKYTIYAPFNGAYTDVFLEVGAVANPGSRLAKIIRTDELELEVPIESRNAKYIKVGSKVSIFSEDGNMQWNGRVVRKTNFIDPQTQSINIFISLRPTADKPLFKGQYLKAVFPGLSFGNVMKIPRSAVFNHNEVFVVIDGKLEKKEVKIIKNNPKTYLISGLKEGIDVVTEPLIDAHENMEVSIFNGKKADNKAIYDFRCIYDFRFIFPIKFNII